MLFDSLPRRRFLTGTAAIALAPALPALAQTADEIDTSDIMEMTMGNPDAAVTVIEYASFTCPHCATFHAGPFKQLKAEYIDTGKVKFVSREVYFDRFGLWAAIVARCGEGAENRYFGIADMVYTQQNQWARQDNPNDVVESLRRIGKTAGLNDEQLDACFTDADNAEKLFARYQQTTEEHGVSSTPTFVINGETYGNMSYDDMKEIIERELADA
ncbi:MAG: DsbA family protein [Pseudomonadota bacterium]